MGWMCQLSAAVSYCHARRIMHRDLKPRNFLYDAASGKGFVTDYGLAETEEDATKRADKSRVRADRTASKAMPIAGRQSNTARASPPIPPSPTCGRSTCCTTSSRATCP